MSDVKPIIKLPQNETVQHPSGKLEKAITYEDLRRNPRKYIQTHPHLYENAQELERYFGIEGTAGRIGSKTHTATAIVKKNGTNTPVFVINGKQSHSSNKASEVVGKMKALAEQRQRSVIAKQNKELLDANNKMQQQLEELAKMQNEPTAPVSDEEVQPKGKNKK